MRETAANEPIVERLDPPPKMASASKKAAFPFIVRLDGGRHSKSLPPRTLTPFILASGHEARDLSSEREWRPSVRPWDPAASKSSRYNFVGSVFLFMIAAAPRHRRIFSSSPTKIASPERSPPAVS
jgi:hypothetical protein